MVQRSGLHDGGGPPKDRKKLINFVVLYNVIPEFYHMYMYMHKNS